MQLLFEGASFPRVTEMGCSFRFCYEEILWSLPLKLNVALTLTFVSILERKRAVYFTSTKVEISNKANPEKEKRLRQLTRSTTVLL